MSIKKLSCFYADRISLNLGKINMEDAGELILGNLIKLSKVDWGITMRSTKKDISLKKRIMGKKSTL